MARSINGYYIYGKSKKKEFFSPLFPDRKTMFVWALTNLPNGTFDVMQNATATDRYGYEDADDREIGRLKWTASKGAPKLRFAKIGTWGDYEFADWMYVTRSGGLSAKSPKYSM